MFATKHTERRCGAWSHLLHVVPPLPERADGELMIDDEAVAARWRPLGEALRARVSAFLDVARWPGAPYDVRAAAPIPEDFARDLATGGATLRSAFPGLVRRVHAVHHAGDAITVHVRCVGEQRGAFFRILSPTARRVTFDVVHVVDVRGERVAEHRVALDLRAIVLQLASVSATAKARSR
jgi:hypothetical protein